MSRTEKFIDDAKAAAGYKTSPAYGKALLLTGGVVLAVWAARKIPWKKLVDADTMDSLKNTLGSVATRVEEIAREYVNGPVAEAIGNTKKVASRIAANTDSATH